jgi:hypothetical protein
MELQTRHHHVSASGTKRGQKNAVTCPTVVKTSFRKIHALDIAWRRNCLVNDTDVNIIIITTATTGFLINTGVLEEIVHCP